jgi:protein tyrosine/serine phosphatase
MEEVVKKYGIKTVISLRGAPENSYWVKPQLEVLQKLGVKFIPASWTTDFFPDRENFLKFAKALKEEQFPILVHCRTGSDRTGEAAAIYSMEFLRQSKEEAIEKNLNFKYWHVKTFHPAKAEFIRRWKGLDQMIETYDVCSPEYRDFAEPKYCPEITPEKTAQEPAVSSR